MDATGPEKKAAQSKPKKKRAPKKPKNKGGRKHRTVKKLGGSRKRPVYTSDVKWRAVVVENLANGTTIAGACKAANIARSTYYKQFDEDAEFARACNKAMKCRLSIVVDSLFVSSRKGDTAAGKFLAKNWSKGEYKDKHEIDTTIKGPPTKVNFVLEPPKDYSAAIPPKTKEEAQKDKPA